MKIYLKICLLFMIGLIVSCNDDNNERDELTNSNFTLSSIAIVDGELLEEYKCEEKVNGIEKSIPLSWSNIPENTTSLAVSMTHYPNPDDPTDISSYLLLWDIDPSVINIPHGAAGAGSWHMGSSKDGDAISYSSPCSKGSGSHEYTLTLYALSESPATLPTMSSIDVTYDVFIEAISAVTVIDKVSLTFNSTTP